MHEVQELEVYLNDVQDVDACQVQNEMQGYSRMLEEKLNQELVWLMQMQKEQCYQN